MYRIAILAATSLVLSAPIALADKTTAPGQDKVCLISFPSPAAATVGADNTITGTKYLPRNAANVQETYTTGGAIRIFDYTGTQADTNAQERALCQSLDPSIP